MSKVKLKNGKAETLLAKRLWGQGLRYRRNYKKLPGSPDIAITKFRIAIFIDGEFWHGKDWEARKERLHHNREYWIEKIEENIARDKRVDQELFALGWTPLRFWEKEVYSDRDTIKNWLASEKIKYEEIKKDCQFSLKSPGVKLSTFHSSKGLEFDAVIIPRFADGIIPKAKELDGADEQQKTEILAKERSFLYVGMTRAKYDLVFTYSGAVSCFLSEFDPELYEHIDARGNSLEKLFRKPIPAPIELKLSELEEQEDAAKDEIQTEEREGGQAILQESNVIKEGSYVIAEKCDTHSESKFFINTQKFSAQKSVVGKKLGEIMEIDSKKYLIKQIF